MHILIPTDVFPPGNVGGAAWSTHTLAHALHQRGHKVQVVVPVEQGKPTRLLGTEDLSPDNGIAVLRWGYTASRIPFVRNRDRHERLWGQLAKVLVAQGQHMGGRLIIHAQHVQTTPAAVLAARQLGVPVVATIRDHWAWHYFATGLHGDRFPYAPPNASPSVDWAAIATDLIGRFGVIKGLLSLPALPYIARHVQRRAAFLAQVDAVIAVSHYIAARLHPIVSPSRLHVVPNMVDIPLVEQIIATPPSHDVGESFLLFVGKLERNKGAAMLVDIFTAARDIVGNSRSLLDSCTLVIVGSGSLQEEITAKLHALGIRVSCLSWVDHDDVLRLMHRCSLLLFPSVWGEPLSRVLLEAGAVGAPMLAMPTGGTSDIITNGEHGMLEGTVESFALRMLDMMQDYPLRQTLSKQARQHIAQRFGVEHVVKHVETVYEQLLGDCQGYC
jgi:glycosyltransferase involved in cell wall biosynthesis